MGGWWCILAGWQRWGIFLTPRSESSLTCGIIPPVFNLYFNIYTWIWLEMLQLSQHLKEINSISTNCCVFPFVPPRSIRGLKQQIHSFPRLWPLSLLSFGGKKKHFQIVFGISEYYSSHFHIWQNLFELGRVVGLNLQQEEHSKVKDENMRMIYSVQRIDELQHRICSEFEYCCWEDNLNANFFGGKWDQ